MHSTERFIKCEAPLSLRGRPFATVTPEEFCPLITEVTIDDIQRYSVGVSWQHREHTGLSGFEIFYQAIDGSIDDEVSSARNTFTVFQHLNRFKIFNSNQFDFLSIHCDCNFISETIAIACQPLRAVGPAKCFVFGHTVSHLCDWKIRKSPIVGNGNALRLKYGRR